MKNKIYESFEAFTKRPSDEEDLNGYLTQEAIDSSTNTDCMGCWECKNCTKCTNCDECYDCYDCEMCSICTKCSQCYRCTDCENVILTECCASCYDCKDCVHCTGCYFLKVVENVNAFIYSQPMASDGVTIESISKEEISGLTWNITALFEFEDKKYTVSVDIDDAVKSNKIDEIENDNQHTHALTTFVREEIIKVITANKTKNNE